ncbi:hypothetical protein IW261DRAFT_1026551 [Armillaria novae-zelandiae]|uniref:Uncharacterized protein n=1 Tax=Armillaria novae-zelandiae TaxID=153914 RepID=A0AA39TDT7_9AGAR|nr:hypothetical protein IW261DRAFT_1026551 [Armillaria novae-zelandiae]
MRCDGVVTVSCCLQFHCGDEDGSCRRSGVATEPCPLSLPCVLCFPCYWSRVVFVWYNRGWHIQTFLSPLMCCDGALGVILDSWLQGRPPPRPVTVFHSGNDDLLPPLGVVTEFPVATVFSSHDRRHALSPASVSRQCLFPLTSGSHVPCAQRGCSWVHAHM